jgi:hypothetical protein
MLISYIQLLVQNLPALLYLTEDFEEIKAQINYNYKKVGMG